MLGNMLSFPQSAETHTMDDLRDFTANRERSYKKCFSRALPSTDAGMSSVAPNNSFAMK